MEPFFIVVPPNAEPFWVLVPANADAPVNLRPALEQITNAIDEYDQKHLLRNFLDTLTQAIELAWTIRLLKDARIFTHLALEAFQHTKGNKQLRNNYQVCATMLAIAREPFIRDKFTMVKEVMEDLLSHGILPTTKIISFVNQVLSESGELTPENAAQILQWIKAYNIPLLSADHKLFTGLVSECPQLRGLCSYRIIKKAQAQAQQKALEQAHLWREIGGPDPKQDVVVAANMYERWNMCRRDNVNPLLYSQDFSLHEALYWLRSELLGNFPRIAFDHRGTPACDIIKQGLVWYPDTSGLFPASCKRRARDLIFIPWRRLGLPGALPLYHILPFVIDRWSGERAE